MTITYWNGETPEVGDIAVYMGYYNPRDNLYNREPYEVLVVHKLNQISVTGGSNSLVAPDRIWDCRDFILLRRKLLVQPTQEELFARSLLPVTLPKGLP